jgi:hypothetical protein
VKYKISALFFFLITTPGFPQNEVKYEKGEMFVFYLDYKTNEVLSEIPFGDNVFLIYDNFTKNYSLVYTRDRHYSDFKFNYIQTKDKTLRYVEERTKETYMVEDNLQKDGSLTLIMEEIQYNEKKQPLVRVFHFKNLLRIP